MSGKNCYVRRLDALAKEALLSSLKSRKARMHVIYSSPSKIAEVGTVEEIIALETAEFNAHGRVFGPLGKQNAFGHISDAKFARYDPVSKTVTIRIGHYEIPEMWIEASFTLDQLQEWIDTATKPKQ